jgi:hypothetical protein
MTKKHSKTQVPPLPPGPNASPDEMAAYFERYTLREVEAAGYVEELTPEQLKYVVEIAKEARARIAARKNESSN